MAEAIRAWRVGDLVTARARPIKPWIVTAILGELVAVKAAAHAHGTIKTRTFRREAIVPFRPPEPR